MVESPKLCFDDVSQEPHRLLTGIADGMAGMGSWNMHARSDMVVAMGPQHAAICANGGLSRADVHRKLCEMAGRKVRDLKGGGNWRRERALQFPIKVDPDDDDCFIPQSRIRRTCSSSSPAAGARAPRSATAGAAAAAPCTASIPFKPVAADKRG
jgi:hypothetical protein